MAEAVATIDLRTLDLPAGGAVELTPRVPPIELRLGGQDYRVEPDAPQVDLRVVRSLSGLHLDLRADVVLVGPCWRCLEEARIPLHVRSSEFQEDGRAGGDDFDDDLDSAYVDADEVLDVAQWSRDAVAESVPATVLCRDDCPGLPTRYGERDEGEAVDPRWDALREVSERLRGEG
ncbi:MAG: DUF177 domain-containing protein [Thermoleophilia bacterium]